MQKLRIIKVVSCRQKQTSVSNRTTWLQYIETTSSLLQLTRRNSTKSNGKKYSHQWLNNNCKIRIRIFLSQCSWTFVFSSFRMPYNFPLTDWLCFFISFTENYYSVFTLHGIKSPKQSKWNKCFRGKKLL